MLSVIFCSLLKVISILRLRCTFSSLICKGLLQSTMRFPFSSKRPMCVLLISNKNFPSRRKCFLMFFIKTSNLLLSMKQSELYGMKIARKDSPDEKVHASHWAKFKDFFGKGRLVYFCKNKFLHLNNS